MEGTFPDIESRILQLYQRMAPSGFCEISYPKFTDRGGCWFCPNAKQRELRHLYDCHPDLWGRMLELQALPGKVSEKFDRKRRFSDIDALFRQKDACKKAA